MPAAAAVRVAQADTYTPRSKLDAVGTTEINGHADTSPVTRMPRARSETVSPALSPARQALAQHLEHLSKLAAEANRKAAPVDRIRQQLSAAHVELQNAELILANIDKAHAAAIAKAAREDCCSEQPVESSDAEAAVERARRNCNSVRMAMEEVNRDLVQANANLTAADTHFDQLALAILVEEHEAHLLIWAKARDAYHLAEINLIGLLAALGERGRTLESSAPGAGLVWLRQLEKMQPPWHHLDHGHVERGGPREVSAASGRWSAVLHRLKSDPGATF
jgi:hypothetical protein